ILAVGMPVVDLLALDDEAGDLGEADLRAAPVDLEVERRQRLFLSHVCLLLGSRRQETGSVWMNCRTMNSAGRTGHSPTCTIMRPLSTSSAVMVLPRPTET